MNREEARIALGDRNNLLWGMSKEEQRYYSEALDMAISALSAEGEYIKKEETAEYVDSYIQEINTGYGDVNSHTNRILRMVSDGIRKMDSYSFPDREKVEQLYSDLLRLKHGTMNIDSLIDKVYEDMRGKT